MTYRFKSKVGLVAISPHKTLHKLVQLWLGTFLIGSYPSAKAAAEAWANSKTGCGALDKLPEQDRPGTLDDWQKGEDSDPDALISAPTKG